MKIFGSGYAGLGIGKIKILRKTGAYAKTHPVPVLARGANLFFFAQLHKCVEFPRGFASDQ
uniref:Uncharacterized protein n=1 Tax=Candidatus Kentrum sp. LPFa TaxID=2126335 RepID=A0A450XYK6_9GAMM|nr:MAG: hypothetical protein BECKLPF1236C_GA0070990_102655 [Candidatus Kentron sp. LPFa]